MEQKQNKQLHTAECPTEYSGHEQQLIYKVISGILLNYSALAPGKRASYSWNILENGTKIFQNIPQFCSLCQKSLFL